LVQVGDVERVPYQPVMPGSGGTIIFLFRTVKIAPTTITLAYPFIKAKCFSAGLWFLNPDVSPIGGATSFFA
jgi:hypothetical protein